MKHKLDMISSAASEAATADGLSKKKVNRRYYTLSPTAAEMGCHHPLIRVEFMATYGSMGF